jgi:hypothetical protein
MNIWHITVDLGAEIHEGVRMKVFVVCPALSQNRRTSADFISTKFKIT